LVDWRRKRGKNGKLVICLGFSRESKQQKVATTAGRSGRRNKFIPSPPANWQI